MDIHKHNERSPAQPTPSAGIFRPGMALMRYRPLQYTLLLLLTLFILAAVAVLATRSIWIDEATLLMSVYEIGLLDFINPLPYYNQASPFVPSVVIKLISEIAETNFFLFRILIFSFILICALPLTLKIKKMYGINGVLALMLVCAANVYNLLLYATEIKHYGFEIAGVFIFLYWFLIYIDDPNEAILVRNIWIPLIAISMGFSTLLLFPAFFMFVCVDCVFNRNKTEGKFLKNVAGQHALVFVLMAVISVAVYMFMSHLTMFQMSDDIYKSSGLKNNFRDLKYATENAFRHIYLIAIVLCLLSIFLNPKTIMFRFNSFFICIVILVVALKVLGLYPVMNNKHVVWMIPVAVTLIAMYISVMLSRKDALGLFLTILISFFFLKESANLYRLYIPEINNNNALYSALEDVEPADILVLSYAQPSLEIYRMKNLALSKHRYFGLMPKSDLLSKSKSPDAAVDADLFIKSQFRQLPQTQSFLVLISHDRSVEEEPAEERIIALRNTMKKNNCGYDSLFKGTLTQLLKVSCAQPREGAPGGASASSVPSFALEAAAAARLVPA